MDIATLLILAFVVPLLLNMAWESRRRIRCGAREGLFGTCAVPTNDHSLRCSRHTGLPKRRFP
jgi:hypothetical protein